MKIWFDMDGTLADLYAVEDWLPKLRAYDSSPYRDAVPMIHLSTLARLLNRLQRQGYEIGIISWLSKDPDPAYGADVTLAKIKWLKKHLSSVNWDHINIVPYGTPKHEICGEGILFDDEERNRESWGENAYDPCEILNVLKSLF